MVVLAFTQQAVLRQVAVAVAVAQQVETERNKLQTSEKAELVELELHHLIQAHQ
jgi:hypothetical protein